MPRASILRPSPARPKQLRCATGDRNAPWIGGETTQDPPDGQPSSSAPFFWTGGPEANAPFTFLDWANNGNPPGIPNPTVVWLARRRVRFFFRRMERRPPVDFNSGYSYVEEYGGVTGQSPSPKIPRPSRHQRAAGRATSLNGPLTVTSVGAAAHGTVTAQRHSSATSPASITAAPTSFTYTISTAPGPRPPPYIRCRGRRDAGMERFHRQLGLDNWIRSPAHRYHSDHY